MNISSMLLQFSPDPLRATWAGVLLVAALAACAAFAGSTGLSAEDTRVSPAPETNASPAGVVVDASKATAPSVTSSTNAVAQNSYEAFKLVNDRNIFNPSRSARFARGDRPEGEPKKVSKVETVSLVGVMSYAKGDLAFFDGSSSDYRKVIKPSDQLGSHRLLEIGANFVQMVTDGKTNRVAIGGGLRRQDDGVWEVVVSGIKSTADASSSPVSSEGGDAATAAASSGGETDLLKRLMQKREQELNNEKK